MNILKTNYTKRLLILGVLLISFSLQAQVKKVFTPRYSASINGDVKMVGNNMLSRTTTGSYNGEQDNHDFVDNVYVDIDSDASTFNSSSANLTNPYPNDSCLVIDKVLLYWAAADKGIDVAGIETENQPNWNYNNVKLMLPGQTTYTTINADEVIYRGKNQNPHLNNDPYVCVKDITNSVKNLGNPFGKYQVANVEAKTGFLVSHENTNTGTSGGWQVIMVYKSDKLKARNITLFDGYANVTSTQNNFDINISGFQTVPNGIVQSDIVIGALEGDRSLTGDRLQILNSSNTFVDISAPLRDANNFFNSRITVGPSNGANNFTDRNPASTNTLGFDAAVFPLNNPGNSLLTNNQTSTTLRLTSNQETYGLFVLGFSVEIYQPELQTIFTATPTLITPTNSPQTITYTANVTNVGNDNANGVSLTTVIPNGAELNLPITGLSSGITYTYNNTTRTLTFMVPNGVLEASQSISLSYNLSVNDNCYYLQNNCSGTFDSNLVATYIGQINPKNISSGSHNGINGCGVGNTLNTLVTINAPAPATWVTATSALDREIECNNPTALSNAQALAPVSSCPGLTPIKTSGTFVPSNNCPTLGTYTNTWNFTDSCGRTIDNYVQIITVKDTTAPVIDTNAFDFTVQCDQNSQAAFNNWLATNGSATATDNCSAVTWSNNYSNLSDDCGVTGSTTVTFTASDVCGNSSSTTATFTIEDTVGPTFDGFPNDTNNDQPSCIDVPVLSFANYTEVLGDGNNNTFLQGEKFRFTNVSPGVDAVVTILATINTTVPLLDDNGNGSVDSFRPQTAFNLTNIGDRAYTEYQIDFIDNTNNQPTPLPEFYTTFSDIDGNANFGEVNWTQFTNSYTVNDPTDLTITEEGPWIVATAGTTEYTGVTNIYPQANITTRNTNTTSFRFRVGIVARKANVSGNLRQHNIEFACISNYTNPSTITDEITLECSDLEDPEVLTATDSCSNATVTFNEIRTDGDCPNTYTLERTWTATDDCGNETIRTLTINVQDTTPPTFVEALPTNTTVDGDNIPDAPILTATDNCGDAIVTFNEEIVGDICTGNQTITREWIATDACDLTTSHTQVITVNQPVLTASIDSVTNILCSTEATGTINIAVSGGSLPYTYSIDGGTTYTSNATINDLAAGNYSIIVLDANECSTTLSAEILSNCTDAIADINNTFVGQAVFGNVLTNDEDFEGDIQTVTANTNPTNGSVTIDAAGNYTYTPNAGFTGEDTFTYTICDDGNPQACDTATVYIEVLPESGPENEAPIANADTATTPEGTPVDIVVLANDFDPDADPIIITNNTTPDNGTVTVNTDGTITYTPNDGFIGEDTFEYTICDNASPALCDTATVTVTVQPDGTPNTTNANDDAYNTTPTTPLTGNVLENDNDIEGNTQTVTTTTVTTAQGVTVTIDANTGVFTYTPNAGYVGTDSFVYTICDNGTPQACDQATVYLTVGGIANTTDAIADINNTFVGQAVSGNVLTNDEDFEGDIQTVTANTNPTNGSVTIDAAGNYTYTPNA
ncbi:Ig-like domain-containing protein, partial [Olleya sp.]|uniref:Ig-like domain-containing protein n=1 Tax=Olleya sp. TaxID=1906788 RepID=UPI0032D9346E